MRNKTIINLTPPRPWLPSVSEFLAFPVTLQALGRRRWWPIGAVFPVAGVLLSAAAALP